MNETFKTELAAFTQDVKAICGKQISCSSCPFSLGEPPSCCANYTHFNLDIAIPAVEAYRKRKKPCAEVIDRALDIYTIEVEVERKGAAPNSVSAKHYADALRKHLIAYYGQVINGSVVVRVLSAKRFVLESHREEE